MPPILVDTNLLVSLYDTGSPAKAAQAQQVLEYLELTRSGRLSVQRLAEFIHVSTHKLNPPLSRAEALDQASLFIRMWPVFDLTPLIVLEAARGARDHGLAYYDAQIWAAACLNQVTLIFSEDFNTGQVLEGVRLANPFSEDFRVEDWARAGFSLINRGVSTPARSLPLMGLAPARPQGCTGPHPKRNTGRHLFQSGAERRVEHDPNPHPARLHFLLLG